MKNQQRLSRHFLIFALMLLISTPAIAKESSVNLYAADTEGELFFGVRDLYYYPPSFQKDFSADDTINFEVYKNNQNGVTFHSKILEVSQGWMVSLGAPNEATLTVGQYEQALAPESRVYGFTVPNLPTIQVSLNDHECYRLQGRFEVFELEFVAENISKFAADFTVYCDRDLEVPVFGSIRFQSDLPVTIIDKNKDFDGDDIPDQVDVDIDNDGEHNRFDAFPFDATETADADNDGVGNNADPFPADELCPNSVFHNGQMWSGDIQLIENTCSKTGQICENTYFSNRGYAGQSACVAGQWRPYQPTHTAILPPISELSLIGPSASGRAPHYVKAHGLGSFSDDGRVYAWDFGDGSPISYEIIPSHIYNEPGTYTMRLTVTDDLGQSDTDTKTIVVAEPLVTFSCPNTIFADGKMWSGELQYIDNTCSDEGAWCPNTYFSDLGDRFDAECTDGKWQQY